MEKTYEHEVVYDFDGLADIKDVVASLLANEKLIKEAIGLLKDCHPGLKVDKLDIKLSEVSQRSPLKEFIAVTLVVAFQEDLEEEVPKFIQDITGMTISEDYDAMITVLVSAIAIWGALALIEKVFKDKKKPKKTEQKYDNVINVAGDLIQIPPDMLREKMDDRFGTGKRRSITKAAKDFFEPAKKQTTRSITTSSDIIIDAEIIEELPRDVDEAIVEPLRDEYYVDNAKILLRAQDLDSEKTGWAGVIKAVSDDRVKVHLSPEISANSLFGKKSVNARVKVKTIENDDGELKPSLYVIDQILS